MYNAQGDQSSLWLSLLLFNGFFSWQCVFLLSLSLLQLGLVKGCDFCDVRFVSHVCMVPHYLERRKSSNWRYKNKKNNYMSYCLLLLERGWTSIPKFVVVWNFFLVAVCFFHFMVCAIFMDSSKVGKWRIACFSCLSRGKKPKQNTHKLQFSLFENALSTHIRQECFFPSISSWLLSFVLGLKQLWQTHFVCFKSLVVVNPLPRWFVSQ